MLVRAKSADDAAACSALLRDTHRSDGYPRYLPQDLDAFVTSDFEVAAWVVEQGGELIGHVALHRVAAVDPTLSAARRATGLPAERLVVVARLLVSPRSRRTGVGQRLLALATAHAHRQGQRVVLEVAQDAAGPIGLYEALGWTRLEPLRRELTADKSLDFWVYLGPEPTVG